MLSGARDIASIAPPAPPPTAGWPACWVTAPRLCTGPCRAAATHRDGRVARVLPWTGQSLEFSLPAPPGSLAARTWWPGSSFGVPPWILQRGTSARSPARSCSSAGLTRGVASTGGPLFLHRAPTVRQCTVAISTKRAAVLCRTRALGREEHRFMYIRAPSSYHLSPTSKMPSIASILLLSASLLVGLTGAAKPTKPAKPVLTHLYSATFTGSAPIDFGQTPLGHLTFTPITGGNFTGPRLNGTIVSAGGDWNLQDAEGTYHPDVRETFKTSDGAYIQLYQTGGSGLQPGGVVYVHLSFVTGSKEYYWLNKVIAVGVLKPVSQTQVTLDAWALDGIS
ncbi:hypothetical protein OPT61_g9220 [Boeremia exigua]|uniref:Uncharacterized protein n=1 Tax=Boeremia exigua TaxID=749465 RepID=A0ACC2HVX3_9PLEO|nr:hypothetical protein OPT61_g9220 [Boeremia exigua]